MDDLVGLAINLAPSKTILNYRDNLVGPFLKNGVFLTKPYQNLLSYSLGIWRLLEYLFRNFSNRYE